MRKHISVAALLAYLPSATGRASRELAFCNLPRFSTALPVPTRLDSPRFRPFQSLSTVVQHADEEDTSSSSPIATHHVVDGILCREIPIDLPVVGTVTVLEATAEAQKSLVDMALALNDEELEGTEQKLAAGDPYGAVLWPAAWAVANYLLTSPDIIIQQEKAPHLTGRPLQDLSILELGTGTGLVSIAAALGGAKVLATDYEPLALTLTKYAAQNFYNANHSHRLLLETQILDICDYDTPIPLGMDLVVAADILYEPKTGIAMARRAVEALHQGSRVLVGDSPGRPGRPAFLRTLKELGLPDAAFSETMGRTCSGPRHELICGKGTTSTSAVPEELPVAIMDLKPSMLSL